jgi:hypothetical protein
MKRIASWINDIVSKKEIKSMRIDYNFNGDFISQTNIK